jgi:hypothetical protein
MARAGALVDVAFTAGSTQGARGTHVCNEGRDTIPVSSEARRVNTRMRHLVVLQFNMSCCCYFPGSSVSEYLDVLLGWRLSDVAPSPHPSIPPRFCPAVLAKSAAQLLID